MKTAILDLIKLLLVELQQERDYPYYLTNFLIEQYQLEKCWNQFTCRQKSKREYFWKAAFLIEHFKIATIGVVLFTFPFFMCNSGAFQAPRKIIISTLLLVRSWIMLCKAGRVHSQAPATTALQLWCATSFIPNYSFLPSSKVSHNHCVISDLLPIWLLLTK